MNFNIGPRMMKTGLAVALSILITESLNYQLGMVAVITAVVAMQPSIMRSITHIKETFLSTLIGIVFALAGAYTIGLHPASIGITVILAIAVNIKLGWVKTVNITILTIAIIMMSGDQTIDLMYMVHRLSLILIGISSAFVINALILPPNHQKILYDMVKKASDKTNFLLRVIPNKTMKVKELKKIESDLSKNIKDINNYLGIIIDEKDRMFVRNRFHFMRDIVTFRQMLRVIEMEEDLIENLELKLEKIEEISKNQSFLVKKLVAKIVEYHENIMLTYEKKVIVQKELQRESQAAMNLTINDLINELQQSEMEKWIDIFPVASSIVKLMVELEQLDKYIRRQEMQF
ncbi:aromatic acid exporter family protein [Ornithinibacillus gellani]|uniref:FUSC family protein n=1 Tax=Ornithinibacillus gellani TaxID=2293253 RepID=UPI000F49BB29|nr:aromatic acid exporter family protein [Ornithinibacillus gellani]TQS74955.1 aromatic acid exporter family protein [Ornithinibacillus gellani]